MTVKSLIAGMIVGIAMTTAGTAFAGQDSPRIARAATATDHKWSAEQLQSLAVAYRAKNPGWRVPTTSGVRIPADMTWTSENLDRLANAYATKNPGWTRP